MSSADARAAKTRRALLEAGTGLLAEGDPSAFTVGAVAKAAGVSRQAAYLHFEGRAQMLLAVVAHANQSIGLARRIRRIEEAPTAEDALAAYVDAAVGQAARLGPAMLALRHLLRTDAALAAAWRERPAGRLAAVRKVIARLGDEGRLVQPLRAARAADLLAALTTVEACVELLDRGWSERAVRRELLRVTRAALLR